MMSTVGAGTSAYGYTGEMQDGYIKLINLRSRTYSPEMGRFLTRDSWQGVDSRPMSLNAWLYAYANPINMKDPSGYDSYCDGPNATQEDCGFIYPEVPDNQMLAYLIQNSPSKGSITTKFGNPNTFWDTKKEPLLPDMGCSDEEKIKWMKTIDTITGHPIGAHPAIDFYGALGDRLFAVAPGKVVGLVTNSTKTAPGYYMIIQHNMMGVNYYSVYFHIQETTEDGKTYQAVTEFRVGDLVNPGDTVAHMGNTGTSDTHLHFEVRREGGIMRLPDSYKLNSSAGYWLSDPSQLKTIWLDISSAFGGYDDWYPKSWREQ